MLKKVTIAFLLMVTALMGVLIYVMPYFINKDGIKSEVISSFKSLTGFDLEIQGDAVVERFPTPHVVINSLYVHNAPNGLAPFLLTVKVVDIWPSYKSLFTHRVIIQKIDINDVDIELEHLKSGQMNWEDNTVRTSAPATASQIGSKMSAGLVGAYINITNGYLRYTDQAGSNNMEFKNVGLNYLNGGGDSESTLRLNMQFRDQLLTVTGKVGNISKALSAGEVPANLSITSGRSELIYGGSAGYKDANFVINGNVKFNTDDVVTWASILRGTVKPPADENFKPLPMKAQTDITTAADGKISFPNLVLDGAIIKGGVQITYSPPYGIDINGIFKLFDLDALTTSGLFLPKEPSADIAKDVAPPKETDFVLTQKSLFESIGLTADIKIDDTLYNQQHINGAHVQLDMTNGEMTISQATATLPGDTRLVFAGIGKEGFQGFALEGEVDATGADFSQAIKLLKSNGASFPEQDFKRFRLKANALLSAKGLRLSEMAARIENMAFLGGFIATFGDRTKIEAAMRVGGVNLDHFIELWGIPQWRASLADSTPGAKYDSFLAHWLRRLDFDTLMNISMEQFTLNGAVRDKADLRLRTTSGRVYLDDVKTVYNGSNVTGMFSLDVLGQLPKIEVKANIDKFDMDTFFTSDGKLPASVAKATPVAAVTPATRWSHDKFDFHWLELLNASFHFKFDEYKQGTLTAKSLDVLGSIDGQKLAVESLTGVMLGAQVAAKSNIVGGAIPSINVAANINGLDPVQLLPFFPVLQGMSGKYNLSLRLDASGIDLYSWVSSLEGTIGVGGVNVDIHGFNLAGVIHSVSYVRTVADILNVVRRAFPGGDTLFSNIEGQWTVSSGVLKTSNSKLTNAQADGILTSEVDLINWQMQSSINLALRALDPAHPPGMIISFTGSIDAPETALDTRSLEQYVTNKTSERMLQEYGTQ